MSERKNAPQCAVEAVAPLREFFDAELRRMVREAVRARGGCIAAALARRLSHLLRAADLEMPAQTEWIKVFSLTTIRNVVGGRFELLKSRWTNAGLPLKAHRGSRPALGVRNEVGWRDLVLWLLKQGYELREPVSEGEHLFEIRRLMTMPKNF